MTTSLPGATQSAQDPIAYDGTVLCATGLEKHFGLTHALRGVDIDLDAGEIVAVMGPSGSGKSTLLHCLAGVIRPDAGGVIYDGRDITALKEKQRSALRLRDFGFVFQFGQLVPDLPAIENVALPLLLSGKSRRLALTVAQEWLDALDLAGFERRLPGELSGGQGQRVALARAFAVQPSVIFADEPTGSLDSLATEGVMELLTGFARENGATVVLVTHNPRVAAYADREIVVRDGRVVAGARA